MSPSLGAVPYPTPPHPTPVWVDSHSRSSPQLPAPLQAGPPARPDLRAGLSLSCLLSTVSPAPAHNLVWMEWAGDHASQKQGSDLGSNPSPGMSELCDPGQGFFPPVPLVC